MDQDIEQHEVTPHTLLLISPGHTHQLCGHGRKIGSGVTLSEVVCLRCSSC